MQILLTRSKNLISVVLSCILLIAWNGGNEEFPGWGYAVNTPHRSILSTARPVESIWISMRRELNMDHRAQSIQVRTEIRKLLADRGKLYHILKAAAPYIYFINTQTHARGLPAELALIPAIESEFNPYDHSTKGAVGLWQLMPETAQSLGVKIRSSYDGRRNVVASTKAALSYFNDLGNNFNGNWYLAIAAYNCGQGRIESATRKTGSHVFWNLQRLPIETKLYVPRLLAVAAIIKDPEKYGVKLPVVNNEPYFTTVKVTKSVNLNKVAKSSGISIDTLHTLNPDYKSSVPAKGATLLVPVNKAPTVKASLPDHVAIT